MKKVFLILIVLYSSLSLFAQKKLLDISTYASWPILTPKQISNDGKFVTYTVGSPKAGTQFIVQGTAGAWTRVIPGVKEGIFAEDSRRLILKLSSDSIGILDLLEDSLCYIPHVASFTVPRGGDGQWLAYTLKKPASGLILKNLFNGKETRYPNVTEFKFSDNGKALAMQVINSLDSVSTSSIVWLDLPSGKSVEVAHGCQAIKMLLDPDGRYVTLLVTDKMSDDRSTKLRYFEHGMDSAHILVDTATLGMEGMTICKTQDIFYSPDGKRILFYLENPEGKQGSSMKSEVKVDIRNYRYDDILKYSIVGKYGPYLAVIQRKTGSEIIRLEKIGDSHIRLEKKGDGRFFSRYVSQNDYVLLDNYLIDREGVDSNKTVGHYHNIFILSYKDGSRVLVKKQLLGRPDDIQFSPTGKYVCWFDAVERQWFTYNVISGMTRKISDKMGLPFIENSGRLNNRIVAPYPLLKWFDGDAAVMIQDRYDAWQVDPEGRRPAMNLTHPYGRNKQLQFQYLDLDKDRSLTLQAGDTLLFSALDLSSKMNGFYRMILKHNNSPEKLMMEPRMYYHGFSNAGASGTINRFFPMKAKFADVYVVERMSASEYPNLCLSMDLRSFEPLTHFEPQKTYNWMTTELHHWKLPDGKEASGILYKPENFDAHQKYPVIFFYYENNSDALNCFIHPELSNGTINIPWFVSNGYLVFTPDIYYKTGYPGQSAYNSVVSAAKYLSKKPFVDSAHLGLQGHSFGGYETNYILSRSHLFAAAAPAAALSDLISCYASSSSFQEYYEEGQGRIGVSMWQRPDLYIENSPIFRADKVTTPTLILHNPKDATVPIIQAQEWYYGLVRAGKKAWLLSYDGEGHTLKDDKNKLDYTIRQVQFFEHYLKGKSAPKWMTVGVDYTLKGAESGLEMDTTSSAR